MLGWLLWTSLLFTLSAQEPCPSTPGVLLCGPQNVREHHDDSHQSDLISITWEDDPSSARVQGALTYEVAILLTDNMKQVHSDAVDVRPDQAGIKHRWNWTSPLPLKCATHSVRLRSRYLNHTSQWSPLQNISGEVSLGVPQVFPKDRVYKAGSNFTFCCILGSEQELVSMKYHGKTMNTTHVSGLTHAMTVHMAESLSDRCIVINCNSPKYGACVYVGYPPDDRDLECETRDLETVECRWNLGKPTNLRARRTTYLLNGRECSPKTSSTRSAICNQTVNIDLGVTNWTLTAKNSLGIVDLRETADLRQRVRMLAPVNVMASDVTATEARLEWRWEHQRYKMLHILCNIQLYNSGLIYKNYSGEGLGSVVLRGLTPAQTYRVRVKCGVREHFWKWGNYSKTSTFHTKEDTPDALDVWMKIERNQTLIVWKPLLANESNGQIQDYEVIWERPVTKERQSVTIHHQPSTNRPPTVHLHPVFTHPLGPSDQGYTVSVTARNSHGRSPPSTITIPTFLPERVVNTEEILGSDGGFDLSGFASPSASLGYVVAWCPTYRECGVEWVKVPAGVNRARIQSESFEAGVKYTLSIYAFSPERVPDLLERREGYVKECIPNGVIRGLIERQTGSEVELSWTGIPPQNQRAFIRGYDVTYVDDTRKTSHSVRTEGPDDTRVTIQNLQSKSYTFTVRAITSAGLSDGTSTTVYIMQDDQFITVIILCLGATFFLLCLATILCYRYRTWLKQELYPDIPKPAWKGDWFIPEEKHQVLTISSCPGCEIDIVGDLMGDTGQPVQENGDEDQEKEVLMNKDSDMLASHGRYGPHQSESIPAPKTSTSSPPFTVSQFRGVEIQNPSYATLELTKAGMEVSLDYQPHMGPTVSPLEPELDPVGS